MQGAARLFFGFSGAGVSIAQTVITIDADTDNPDILSLAGSPTEALSIRVDIAAGVIIGSSSILTPALDLTNLPAGSSVELCFGDGAKILGKGGAVAGNGGPALETNLSTTLTGAGLIAGGGGGGANGSSGSRTRNYYWTHPDNGPQSSSGTETASGGSGGAGAGSNPASGASEAAGGSGASSGGWSYYPPPAQAQTFGYTTNITGQSNPISGGDGGDLGQAGANNSGGGGTAGAAGDAIVGMSNVTQIGTTTITGNTTG